MEMTIVVSYMRKMKIPNYYPEFSTTNDYKQGHPCTPADVFRMLICGPSNSGKTNTLLHMIYKLLEFDKVYRFSKNHQNKYQAPLHDFAANIDPVTGYEVIEAPEDEIIPLKELPIDSIVNYFINGRHRKYSVIYLTQTYYNVPKNIRDNCNLF